MNVSACSNTTVAHNFCGPTQDIRRYDKVEPIQWKCAMKPESNGFLSARPIPQSSNNFMGIHRYLELQLLCLEKAMLPRVVCTVPASIHAMNKCHELRSESVTQTGQNPLLSWLRLLNYDTVLLQSSVHSCAKTLAKSLRCRLFAGFSQKSEQCYKHCENW